MFLQQVKENRFARLVFVGLAFLIALLYDWFVWDAQLGFGVLLFVVSALALFTLLIFKTKKGRQQWAVLMTIPIIIMAADVVLYSNSLVTYGVPGFILVLTLLYFVLYPLENPKKERFLLRTIPIFKSIDLPFLQWAAMYRDLFRWNNDVRKDVVRKILIGLLFALPIVILFGWLFAAADEVFKDWILNVLDIELIDVWRLFRTFAITLFLGSLLYSVIRPDHVVAHKDVVPRKLDTVIVSIILGFVNLLFAVFVFFQIKYLFGGAEFLLENGMTYAEYARKGFFQLCWVIVLAAILLLVIYRSFVYHKRAWLVTVFQIVLIGLVGVVAASALKRMNLYQDVFGFTVLRLYVEWFLYFVLALLAFSGVSLIARLQFRIFFYTGLAAGVVALTIVTSVNVDYLIAKENVRRTVEDGKTLDFHYLSRLSSDVLPALHPLVEDDAFQKLSLDQQISLLYLLDDNEHELAERTSWKELHFGSIKAQLASINIEGAQQRAFRDLRVREKQFSEVTKEVQSRQPRWCDKGYDPLLPSGTHSIRFCFTGTANGQNVTYYLMQPHQIATTEEAENKSMSDDMLLIVRNVTTGAQDIRITLPLSVRKEHMNNRNRTYRPRVAKSPGTQMFLHPQERYDYENDIVYIANNNYALLNDGRLIESNFATKTHKEYTVFHQGDSARLSEAKEIQTLE